MNDKPSIEEIADGFTLWQEHRPQSPDDWIAVARRINADGGPDESADVILKALCKVSASIGQETR